MTTSGWEEGKVLEVGEGFKNIAEAKRWAKSAKQRLSVPGRTSPSHYRIGVAY